MELDELQAKYLELEENYKTLKEEHDTQAETIITITAENKILRENNQKLFERASFAEPPKEEKEEPPKPQGFEAIKELYKRGN